MRDKRFFHVAASMISGLTLLMLSAAASPALAQESKTESADKPKVKLPPAKEIIAKYIKATGGEQAYRKHSSSHAKGTMSMPAMGMSGTLEAFAAKPNRMLIKIDMPGMGVISQGFDGKVSWSNHPMMGPAIQEGAELEQRRIGADYYGEIRKDKLYKSMETVDLTEFEGKKCYKIKLVPEKGFPVFEFYDVQSGLRRGSQMTAITAMGEMPVTSIESEYKKMGDLVVATKTVQKMMMQEIVIKIESIEFDKVDDAVFKLPPEIETLTKEAMAEPKSEPKEPKSDKP